jgi:hypothetical protein
MMLLPLVCICLIIVAWIYEIVRKYCCLHYRKWSRINSHGSMIIGLTLLLMYFFYLELIRRTLDVFNCKETDPSDGNFYAGFTSIGCDGGYCICWEPGGVHARIAVVNIVPIIVYVIGFPTFVYFIIKKNRVVIMEDQLLRAHDLGTVEAENRFAFWIRQRYSRMYYQFKPASVGWIIIILFRKFMIVLIGGLLRHNPAFQLSIMMLVLFTCYILHMKHRPYMSTVERLLVIEESKALAEQGDEIHIVIQMHIKEALDDLAAKKLRKTNNNRSASSLGSALAYANREGRDDGPESFFFNYNTMEAILLSCAILVCLCGVMFVSGELYLKGNEFLQIVATMFLTSIVLGSMVYIGVVFASEMRVKVPNWLMRCFADAKTALEMKKEKEGLDGNDGDIELNANPLLKSLEEKERLQEAHALAEAHKEAAAKSQEHADQLLLNMRNLKKKAATAGPRRRNKKKTTKKKIKEMKQTTNIDTTTDSLNQSPEFELSTMMSNLDNEVVSRKEELSLSKKSGKKKPNKKKKGRSNKKKILKKHLDESFTSTEGIDMDIFEMQHEDAFVNPLHGGGKSDDTFKIAQKKTDSIPNDLDPDLEVSVNHSIDI